MAIRTFLGQFEVILGQKCNCFFTDLRWIYGDDFSLFWKFEYWLRSDPPKIGQSRKIAFFSLFPQNCQPLNLIKSHLLSRRPEMNTGGKFYHFWNKVLTMLWPSENWPKKKNAFWWYSSSKIAARWLDLIKSYLLFHRPRMDMNIWGRFYHFFEILSTGPLKIDQSRKMHFWHSFIKIAGRCLFTDFRWITGEDFITFLKFWVLTPFWPSENWPKQKKAFLATKRSQYCRPLVGPDQVVFAFSKTSDEYLGTILSLSWKFLLYWF